MNKIKIGIFIGRFQPFHNGHYALLKQALNDFDEVFIVIGSSNRYTSIKNPFSFSERMNMIYNSIKNPEKIKFIKSYDYLYNEQKWISEIEEEVYNLTINYPSCEFYIIGHEKDDSSYYLNSFPNFKIKKYRSFGNVSGTEVKNLMFQNKKEEIKKLVPTSSYDIVRDFMDTWDFDLLKDDFKFYEQEKVLFKDYPYQETLKFTTADVVLTCNGFVLLIKRKHSPGKGVYALPGGFVNRNESFKEAAIRELLEETNVKVSKRVLEKSIKGEKMFDSPYRNIGIPRVSMCYHIDIDPDFNEKGGAKLPKIKKSEETINVEWVPLFKVKSMKLFDDHADMIEYFTRI